jgi:hypothetical protein
MDLFFQLVLANPTQQTSKINQIKSNHQGSRAGRRDLEPSEEELTAFDVTE